MSIFRFKQFTVCQDQCAMKVGTDGVLLGTWTNVNHCQNALDIGTGTGVIALILAQRNPQLNIEAVEIDKNAYLQAKANFEDSKWSDRLIIYNQKIQNYNPHKRYDLIISNPPYFPKQSNKAAEGKARKIARRDDSLPHQELLKSVYNLLASSGQFSLILPFIETQLFIQQAIEAGLYLVHKVDVYPRENSKKANRCLMTFKKQEERLVEEKKIIRKAGNKYHDYTDWYYELKKDFYTIF